MIDINPTNNGHFPIGDEQFAMRARKAAPKPRIKLPKLHSSSGKASAQRFGTRISSSQPIDHDMHRNTPFSSAAQRVVHQGGGNVLRKNIRF